jgi:hypothetical protein
VQSISLLNIAVTVWLAPSAFKKTMLYDIGDVKGAVRVTLLPPVTLITKVPAAGALVNVTCPVRVYVLLVVLHAPGVAVILLITHWQDTGAV